MLRSEPIAFSPPSKNLSLIFPNLCLRLSSVSVLLTPWWITFYSNEAAGFKTINLLLTAVLSCTSNKSICLNSHVPAHRGMRETAKATTLKWQEVQISPESLCKWHPTQWAVAEPNYQLACLFQSRKTLNISFLRKAQHLAGKRRLFQRLLKQGPSQWWSEASLNWLVRARC